MAFFKRTAGAAALVAALLLGVASAPVQGAYIVMLEEVGSDVIATGSGSIDLAGLTRDNINASEVSFMWPARGIIVTGPTSSSDADVYSGFTGPASFGSGNQAPVADSGSGNIVGISGFFQDLFVPEGYVSGAPLSNTATYLNQTFLSLGVTQGIYEWTWGTGPNQDFFRLIIGTPASVLIPEPASAALLGTALAGLLLAGRIRRTKHNA